MNNKNPIKLKSKSISVSKKDWVFNIYITGDTPNCVLAQANLKQFCDSYLPNQFIINVINLLLEPERAQKDEIMAIPTIIKLQPEPKRQIIGDFSNHDLMIKRLGLNTSPKPKTKTNSRKHDLFG